MVLGSTNTPRSGAVGHRSGGSLYNVDHFGIVMSLQCKAVYHLTRQTALAMPFRGACPLTKMR